MGVGGTISFILVIFGYYTNTYFNKEQDKREMSSKVHTSFFIVIALCVQVMAIFAPSPYILI